MLVYLLLCSWCSRGRGWTCRQAEQHGAQGAGLFCCILKAVAAEAMFFLLCSVCVCVDVFVCVCVDVFVCVCVDVFV